MSKLISILLVIAVLVFVLPACSFQGVSTPEPSAANTALAQLIAVALTQTASAVTAAPIATFTPALPTPSPTASLSPTPVFSPTPLTPQIRVSVATNCRVGPGKVYDRVGALLVDEVAEVYGRDPTGNYWYIRNPDEVNGYCWLWGNYATLTGNFAALPVFTPPPTPTPVPGFDASYAGLDTCVSWWVDIKLENTGGVTFKSLSITLRDTFNNTVVALSADGFTDNDGCSGSSTRDNLNPGGTRFVSTPAFSYDPTGHKLRATITLCSNKGVSGTCVSDSITFTP